MVLGIANPRRRARPLRACAAHDAPGTGATLRRRARAGPRRDVADDSQPATATPDATSARAWAALTTTSSPGRRLRPTTKEKTGRTTVTLTTGRSRSATRRA